MTIPVLLVSGYLGAGKTTLINAFLRAPKGLRATVLVNDFGKINIDAELIANADGDTIALTNGCACCTIGDDLLAAALRAAGNKPDLVVVEASGVADPGRLANVLMGAGALAPARCVTLVNAMAAGANQRNKYIKSLFERQIARADALIVNRRPPDGADAGCEALLRRLAPSAARIDDLHKALGPLSGTANPAARFAPDLDHANFATRTLAIPEARTADDLRAVLEGLPPGTQRAKGFARIGEQTFALHQVQGEISVTPCSPVRDALYGQLVVIGTEAGADVSVVD